MAGVFGSKRKFAPGFRGNTIDECLLLDRCVTARPYCHRRSVLKTGTLNLPLFLGLCLSAFLEYGPGVLCLRPRDRVCLKFCGRGGMVDAPDLVKIECSMGNHRSRTAQIRGNLHWQSRAKPLFGEGVETRRAAPKAAMQR